MRKLFTIMAEAALLVFAVAATVGLNWLLEVLLSNSQ